MPTDARPDMLLVAINLSKLVDRSRSHAGYGAWER
jgi:hypothetical protein